jgi:hypothetical protein
VSSSSQVLDETLVCVTGLRGAPWHHDLVEKVIKTTWEELDVFEIRWCGVVLLVIGGAQDTSIRGAMYNMVDTC